MLPFNNQPPRRSVRPGQLFNSTNSMNKSAALLLPIVVADQDVTFVTQPSSKISLKRFEMEDVL